MPFGTPDREFTAQIQKRSISGWWVPCGNTTFIVHGDRISLFDSDAFTMRAQIRMQAIYGAHLSRPNIRFTTL